MMSRHISFVAIIGIFLIAADLMPQNANAQAPVGECEWSYSKPNEWSMLCGGVYKLCGTGHRQSPISVDSSKIQPAPRHFKPLTIDYGELHHSHVEFYDGIIHIVDTTREHTIRGGSLPEDKPYVLRQFHFHTPGEHALDSLVSPLEIHFVHTTNGGTSTAVLAVRFRERNLGDEGEVEWLDQIMAIKNLKKQQSEWADQANNADNSTSSAPGQASSPSVAAPSFSIDDIPTISIKSILPKHFDYLEYSGSLTTPPCTENVHWFLLTNYADIEYSQIRKLTLWEGLNNRPMSENYDGQVYRFIESEYQKMIDDVEEDSGSPGGVIVAFFLLGLFFIVAAIGIGVYGFVRLRRTQIPKDLEPQSPEYTFGTHTQRHNSFERQFNETHDEVVL